MPILPKEVAVFLRELWTAMWISLTGLFIALGIILLVMWLNARSK